MNHRILQAFEAANFMRITSNGSDLAILAGDLNSEPNDICYKLISLGANMKDCYSMVIIFHNKFNIIIFQYVMYLFIFSVRKMQWNTLSIIREILTAIQKKLKVD